MGITAGLIVIVIIVIIRAIIEEINLRIDRSKDSRQTYLNHYNFPHPPRKILKNKGQQANGIRASMLFHPRFLHKQNIDVSMSSQPQAIQFIPANCPYCGGELRVPENKGRVKCMYCGHDVIINDPNKVKVPTYIDVDTVMGLARTALKGQNYNEAYNYFSRVLEQEPDNTEAWLGKGYTAGMMSTDEHPRYDEAIEYILKTGLTGRAKTNNTKDWKNIIPEEYITMAEGYLSTLAYMAFALLGVPRKYSSLSYEQISKEIDDKQNILTLFLMTYYLRTIEVPPIYTIENIIGTKQLIPAMINGLYSEIWFQNQNNSSDLDFELGTHGIDICENLDMCGLGDDSACIEALKPFTASKYYQKYKCGSCNGTNTPI